ncbi:MAG: hypothetical protein KC478_03495 [Bacteriovoracaceae bacterium]|nr:hypothetical protein [Bacteriovoracaceae bacterium]
MFNFAFRNKKMVRDLAKEIAQETSKELSGTHNGHTNQLQDIKHALTALVDKIESLERRLDNKELKDRQTYGHLQYKISELQTDFSKN